MRKRVVDELTTTFKSHYSHRITLAQALDPAVLAATTPSAPARSI